MSALANTRLEASFHQARIRGGLRGWGPFPRQNMWTTPPPPPQRGAHLSALIVHQSDPTLLPPFLNHGSSPVHDLIIGAFLKGATHVLWCDLHVCLRHNPGTILGHTSTPWNSYGTTERDLGLQRPRSLNLIQTSSLCGTSWGESEAWQPSCRSASDLIPVWRSGQGHQRAKCSQCVIQADSVALGGWLHCWNLDQQRRGEAATVNQPVWNQHNCMSQWHNFQASGQVFFLCIPVSVSPEMTWVHIKRCYMVVVIIGGRRALWHLTWLPFID